MAEEITPAATRSAAGWHVMPPRAGHMAGDVRPPGQTCLARPRGAPQLGERAPPACKYCLLGRPCTPAMEGTRRSCWEALRYAGENRGDPYTAGLSPAVRPREKGKQDVWTSHRGIVQRIQASLSVPGHRLICTTMDAWFNRRVPGTGMFDHVGERSSGGSVWTDLLWRRTRQSGRDCRPLSPA
jgi:hypothetical protein